MPEPTTYTKIDSMIAHLLALIWEHGQSLRLPTVAGSKAMVFHGQAITELAKAVRELSYALEVAAMAPMDETDDDPPQPQTEPAEWDQERKDNADDATG